MTFSLSFTLECIRVATKRLGIADLARLVSEYAWVLEGRFGPTWNLDCRRVTWPLVADPETRVLRTATSFLDFKSRNMQWESTQWEESSQSLSPKRPWGYCGASEARHECVGGLSVYQCFPSGYGNIVIIHDSHQTGQSFHPTPQEEAVSFSILAENELYLVLETKESLIIRIFDLEVVKLREVRLPKPKDFMGVTTYGASLLVVSSNGIRQLF